MKSTSSAVPVPEPVLGGAMVARLPSLAANLGISQTPAKASQLLGPPPRVRHVERTTPAAPMKEDEPLCWKRQKRPGILCCVP